MYDQLRASTDTHDPDLHEPGGVRRQIVGRLWGGAIAIAVVVLLAVLLT